MVKPMIKLLEGSASFPITLDQLEMLLQGNVCDPTDWARTFGLQPTTYAEGIAECFT